MSVTRDELLVPRGRQPEDVMAKCEVCHNDYDKAMEITVAGQRHVFSAAADAAQRWAMELPRRLGAELLLTHVTTDLPPLYQESWGLADAAAVVEEQRKWATDTLQSRVDAIAREGLTARAKIAV